MRRRLESVGVAFGVAFGAAVGVAVGPDVGVAVGAAVGALGSALGFAEGAWLGGLGVGAVGSGVVDVVGSGVFPSHQVAAHCSQLSFVRAHQFEPSAK